MKLLKPVLLVGALLVLLTLFMPQLPAMIDGWVHHTVDTAKDTVEKQAPALLHTKPDADQVPDQTVVANTGVHKCIDAHGVAIYSNEACAPGQTTRDVQVSSTTVLNLNAENARRQEAAAAAASAAAGDPVKGNGQTALHQKFGPAP